jgi:hypothetical protein
VFNQQGVVYSSILKQSELLLQNRQQLLRRPMPGKLFLPLINLC